MLLKYEWAKGPEVHIGWCEGWITAFGIEWTPMLRFECWPQLVGSIARELSLDPEKICADLSEAKAVLGELSRVGSDLHQETYQWLTDHAVSVSEIREILDTHYAEIQEAADKRQRTAARRSQFTTQRKSLFIQMIDSGIPYVCCVAGCGVSKRLTIDHKVPISRGGGDELDNLQFMCGPHNAAKGDRLDWDAGDLAQPEGNFPMTTLPVQPLIFNGPKVVPFPKAKARGRIEVKAKGETEGEVWLYGDIGQDWYGEGNTAKGLSNDLKALGAIKTLNVYINSPGGSVFEGVAIYNILRRHSARKIVHIDGLAASIASVIAMAGDEIRIALNGLMMIHNPWGLAFGEASDFRKMADSLDKIRDAIVDTYELRTHQTAETLSAMMDEETWLSADEALELGFVDEVTVAIEAAAFAGVDVSAFRHPPETLKAAAAAEPRPAPPEGGPEAEPDQTATTSAGKPHVAIAKAEAALRRRGLLTA